MEIEILKAILHKHSIKSDDNPLTEVEIDFPEGHELTKEAAYLEALISENSKKNAGKLAKFESKNSNDLYKYSKYIITDYEYLDFVKCTQRIMNDLIIEHTHKNSTSGNYLFVKYNLIDEENFLTDDGKTQQLSINEIRFAILKFENSDSKFLTYETNNEGKRVAKINIMDDSGLPDLDQPLKKACFIHNPLKNKLHYEIRVIDREGSGIARFFTHSIINCSYIVRPKDYVVNLKTVTLDFLRRLRDEDTITEEQETEAADIFKGYIQLNNTINTHEMGKTLLTSYIEDEEEVKFYNDLLLEKYYSKGLTYNTFQVTESDIERINQKKYIRISKNSYLKYTQNELDEKLISFDEGKKSIIIQLDSAPSKLERNE